MIKKITLTAVAFIFILSCKTKQQTSSQTNSNNFTNREPYILLDSLTVVPDNKKTVIELPRYNASVTRVNDLLHTKLEVKFDWQKQYLYGKATLTLKPYYYSTDSLELDAKGMDIKEVSVLNNNVKTPLLYNYDKKKLKIKLNRSYLFTEKYDVFIEYTAKPNELEVKGSSAITSDKGLYFINPLGDEKNKPMQIWTQGETEASSCWFPTIDKPNERMTQEIYITIEKKYATLSNGILVYSKENTDGTKTDYWKQELGAAPYLTMMAIGEYSIVKDKWKRPSDGKVLDVNYYVEKEYEIDAKAIFGNTPEMLQFYSKVLGVDYPWEKYSQIIVRDYVSGAMENTSAVIHGEFLNRTTREMIDRDNEDVIAHELFHHWFGDLVTCESWANLPLNESFATYGEYLWIEYKYGRDEADMHHYESMTGYLAEASRKQENLIRFGYEDKEDMFDGHSYNKGGQILHMLRKIIGDDAFFASLKLYLENNKYKPAEIHQLRLAFEEITGKDLNWFFNQWFLSSGHPDLIINHNYDATDKKYTVSIKQVQDFATTPLFQLPMAIDIYAGGKVTRHEIIVTKQSQNFVFECPANPDLVNVDAEKMVLCTKTENKPMEQWIYEYSNAPLYLDRYESLTKIAKESSAKSFPVILKSLDDKFWDLRLYGIKKISSVLNDENKNQVKEKMKLLAVNDKKSLVRAEAVEFLATNFPDDKDLLSLYKQAVNDQSYAVLGQALNGLTKLSPDEGMKMCAQFENEKTTSLLLSVANVYSKYAGEDKNDFFLKTAPKIHGFSNISFATYYVEFLKRCSDETIDTGVALFAANAKSEKSKWIKYFWQKSVNDIIKFYTDKQERTQSKINQMKEVNNDAVGLKKMEDELEKTKLQREKITAIYNELIK
jgi:aminopeptidase N